MRKPPAALEAAVRGCAPGVRGESRGRVATDGLREDLMANERGPSAAHERTPLFVGSVDDVAELLTYGDVRQVAKTYAL